MRSMVYFLRGIVEFIFGSFIPSSPDRRQPINPVGAIAGPTAKAKPESDRDKKERDRSERLVLLQKCWEAEYRVEHPVRGNQDQC